MEAILPFKIKNEQQFFEFALKVGFDEMQTYKFIYVMQQSDLDIFAKMHDERIYVLIYCWELCEDYKHKLNPDEWELPEELETILKLLVPWSLDIWFSKEWDKCKPYLKLGLIHCLNRARDLLMRMPDMMQINWDFLLLYNLTPWNVAYLRNLNVKKEKTLETGAQSIETEEQPATVEDSSYVKLEQLPLIVLRLVKLFDQCSIDMVKTLCMRVIAAWNKIYHAELEVSSSRLPYIPPEDKRCLLLICHIYLMAVYESDDVKGYVIDNMINNIRFYYQGFQKSKALYAMDNLEYTPARFIALTKIHLRLQKREFFDFFIWNKYDTSLVNLFGVVSQAYKSYLLGNLLMDINNMNEDDFAANVPLYKRLMNSYVNEREKSELFMLSELQKLEAQRYAHNIILTTKNMTDFKSKICKGNRMSNIGNYENSDDALALSVVENADENDIEMKEPSENSDVTEGGDCNEVREVAEESDLRLDPIFQNIPNNENILYYVYDVLAKKDYKGWYFAKIVLLVKIIGHELNMIETWRYHPGLTTDFMLNLDIKLSKHYADLAKIFKAHPFIEQEFWLTAFYLNPTAECYETIKRLGMRNNRKRTDEHTKLVMSVDNIDAKYGLLSSTIDVKDIAGLENNEEPDGDYDPIYSALKTLRLPDSLIKDMLTTVFLPRNRSFAWVVDWTEMRNRCKILLNNAKEKKRFVEFKMAEANDHLKFLHINYEKYKNRPQLDYGTIEQGYETLMNREDFDRSEDEEEEEEDFEDDEDAYENKRGGGKGNRRGETKKEERKIEDDNSQEDDPYLTGKRRTRSRVAATVASYLFQAIPRATRRKRNQNNELEAKVDNADDKTNKTNDDTKVDKDDVTKDNDDKSNDSKSPITTSDSLTPPPVATDTGTKDDEDSLDIVKINIKECLNERPTFLNSTPDFQPLIDIWNVEKSDIQSIDSNCVSLLESSTILRRMSKLKSINKQTGLGCNNREAIDENEMLIMNTDYPMKTIFSTPKSDFNITAVTKFASTDDEKIIAATASDVEKEIINFRLESTDLQELEAVANEDETSSTDKVDEQKYDDVNMNQEPLSTDDNSNDSIKCDVSTAALQDSVEPSQSNLEHNSKRNSENNVSHEMEDNAEKLQNTAVQEQNENAEIEPEIIKEVNENQEMEDISEKLQNTAAQEQNEEAEIEPEIIKEVNENQEMEENSEKLQNTAAQEQNENAEIEPEIIKEVNENQEMEENSEKLQEQNDNAEIEPEIIKEVNENQEMVDKSEKLQNTSAQEQNEKAEIELEIIKEVNENQEMEEKSEKLQEQNENAEIEPEIIKEVNENQEMVDKSEKLQNTAAQEQDENAEIEPGIIKEVNENQERSNDDEINESKTESFEENQNDEKLKEIFDICDIEKTVVEESAGTKTLNETQNENQSDTEISKESTDNNAELKTNDENTIISKCDKDFELTTTNEILDSTESTPIIDTEIIEECKDNVLELKPVDNLCDNIEETCQNIEFDANKCETNTERPPSLDIFDDISMESLRVDENDKSDEESEEEKYMKQMCLTKPVKVVLRKLRPADVTNLRQPKIRVKRINVEKSVKAFKAKQKLLATKVYLDTDDSSNNSSMANSDDAYRPPKIKQNIPPRRHSLRQLRSSESENDSNNSEDIKEIDITSERFKRKRRLSTPISSTLLNDSSSSAAAYAHLIVTPRSASGLKLRISNAEHSDKPRSRKRLKPSVVVDDVIQLSSSSDVSTVSNTLNTIDEVIENDDHPLYEEEIII